MVVIMFFMVLLFSFVYVLYICLSLMVVFVLLLIQLSLFRSFLWKEFFVALLYLGGVLALLVYISTLSNIPSSKFKLNWSLLLIIVLFYLSMPFESNSSSETFLGSVWTIIFGDFLMEGIIFMIILTYMYVCSILFYEFKTAVREF